MSDQGERLYAKLEAAHGRANEYGRLKGRKDTADDILKSEYGRIMGLVSGDTVGERDAAVRRHPEYLQAIEDKENKVADWTTAEIYVKLLIAELDLHRTEEKTKREVAMRQ